MGSAVATEWNGSYYPFDEGVDDDIYGQHLTQTNGAIFTTNNAVGNGSYDLSTTSDNLKRIPFGNSSTPWNLSDVKTIDFWFNSRAEQADANIMYVADQDNNPYWRLWYDGGQNLEVYHSLNGGFDIMSDADVDQGVWNHIIIMFEPDGTTTYWLNGTTQNKTDPDDIAFDGNMNNFYIGVASGGATGSADDYLDNIFFSKDLYTREMIEESHNSGDGYNFTAGEPPAPPETEVETFIEWTEPKNETNITAQSFNITFYVNSSYPATASLYRNDTIIGNLSGISANTSNNFTEHFPTNVNHTFLYFISVTDANGSITNTENRTVYINTTLPPLIINWTTPTNHTQHQTNALNFTIQILNASAPYNISLYRNGTIITNLTNVVDSATYNITEHYATDLEAEYLYKITVSDSEGTISESGERTIYIDNVFPNIITNFQDNTLTFNNLTGQFNFSDDFNIFSYAISIDGEVWDNATDLDASQYNYTLNFDVTNLSASAHTLQINASDGHTARALWDKWQYSRNVLTKSITFSFGDDKWIKVYPESWSPFESFFAIEETDKFSWVHDRTAQSSKESYRVVSSHPLTYIEDSSYKAHIVSNQLKKWVDFNNNDGADATVTQINEKEFLVELSGLKDENVYINSIGDLNTVSAEYTFHLGNATTSLAEQVIETSIANYQLNLLLNSSYVTGINANISINGTVYTNVTSINASDYYNYSYQYNIPEVLADTNISVFWNYTVQTATSTYTTETTPQTQTWLNLGVSNCSYNSSNAVLSLIPKDELFLSPINNSEVDALFTIFVVANGSQEGAGINTTFELSGEENYTICMDTNNQTIYTDAHLQYTATDYSIRNYYLVNYSLTQQPNETEVPKIDLWLLNDTLSSDIVVNVQDQDGNYVQGAYVYAYRKDIGTNTLQNVEIEKTGWDGDAGFKLQLADALYGWIVKYDGAIYKNTLETPAKLLTTTKYFTINLETTPLFYLEGLRDVESNLDFDNDTLTYIYTYADYNSIIRAGYMEVRRSGITRDFVVCSNSTTGTAGSMICPIETNYQGNDYYAVAWVDTTSSNSNHTMAMLPKSFNDAYKRWGMTGIFSAILMIFTISAVFISNGVGAIVGCILAYLGLALMGVIPFGWSQILVLTILGGIIIFRLKE